MRLAAAVLLLTIVLAPAMAVRFAIHRARRRRRAVGRAIS
jgi:hypothetical protein